jgi:replicative DNA helicase
MNIISNGVSESYEKMSSISEAMIPLKKSLGCALIAGAQLNRGNEREDRRPERMDLRDSGSLEEDAHRIISLHRPKKDRNGIEQELDKVLVDYELLQLKLRDGPLTACKIKFDAPHTSFMDDLG